MNIPAVQHHAGYPDVYLASRKKLVVTIHAAAGDIRTCELLIFPRTSPEKISSYLMQRVTRDGVRDHFTAEVKEIEFAKEEGIEFLFQNNIVKIIGSDSVEKIECIKTKLVKKEGESREIPVNIPNSNYEIKVDYVIMATGSSVDTDVVSNLGLETTKNGYIKVNENFETSKKNVFAGGDLIGNKSTVAWAARAGREAASAISSMC